MQPKCLNNVCLTAKKFKEACMDENNDENSNFIKSIIDLLFNPDVALNTATNSVNKITDFISPDIGYDEFKRKGISAR